MRFPCPSPILSPPHPPFSPVKSTLFKPHQTSSTPINPPPFLSIVGGTTNIFNSFVSLARWTDFGANSHAVFRKGCSFKDYTRQWLKRNTTVEIHEQLRYNGSWESRCVFPSTESGAQFLIDAKVVYENASIGFDTFLDGTWHMLRDYCFSSGWITGINGGTMHLNGHPQRIEKLVGAATISSTNAPATFELSTATGYSFTNSVVFAGHAGVRMMGGGEVVLKGASTSDGSVEVESGVMELAGTWLNASSVSVSGAGVLKIGVASGKAFGKDVTMRLSGAGGIELPAGRFQHVGALYLDGSDEPAEPGVYKASNTHGLVRSGEIHVGEFGTVLIFR